jgi:hypothetical protein
MYVGLHGAEWEVEHRGDFLIGAALDVAQQDARAILRPEPSARALDLAAELPPQSSLEGGLLAVAELERRGLDGLGRRRVGRPVERETLSSRRRR